MLPSPIQTILEKKEWYLRWRYSPFILRLWFILRRSVERCIRRQGNRYLSQLFLHPPANRLVFDIGAHEGFLTQFFLDAGYEVVAVEPDQRNYDILRARFENNPKVKLVKAAVSDEEGLATFYESEQDRALGTLSSVWSEFRKSADKDLAGNSSTIEVATTTLDELIKTHGEPALIKIDVEGHERAVLDGLSGMVMLLTFEAILPLFLEDSIAAIQRLVEVHPGIQFNYATDQQLVFPQPVTADQISRELPTLSAQTIEIFCYK